MMSSKTKREKALRPILECPICLKVQVTKIYQCPNAHHICVPCYSQLLVKVCQECRAPFQSPPMRARSVEKMIAALKLKEKCEYQGCRFKGSGDALSIHQPRCPCRKIPCPILTCNEVVKAKDVLKHVKSPKNKHVDIKLTTHKVINGAFVAHWLFNETSHKDSIATWTTGVYTGGAGSSMLQEKTFFVCLKKCDTTGMFYTWVKVNDHKDFADCLRVKITFKGKDEDMKTSFRSKVFSLDETEDKIALETSGFNEFHINKLLKTNVNQDEEGQNRRIMEARYEIERL